MAAARITAALVLSGTWLALLVRDIFTMSAYRDDFGISSCAGHRRPHTRKPMHSSNAPVKVCVQRRGSSVRLEQMRGVAYGDSLIAFALYGNHAAGTALDPDEVRMLDRLCASAAHAYAKLQYRQYRAWYESAHSVRATE